MVTENQSKAFNDIKSQSKVSFCHERHGTTAGIPLQNDYDGDVTVRQGKKMPAKSELYFRCTRMVTEDDTGRGQRTSKRLKNE